MKYNTIRKMDISNGEGIGISLFCQGCDFHCFNCFNKETWDFNGGKEWTQKIENDFLKLAEPFYISRISILGGEPLHSKNVGAIFSLCKTIKQKFPNKKIWLYTGNIIENLIQDKTSLEYKILQYIDVLVDGRYVHELRDPKCKWKGSTNQRVILMKDYIKENGLTFS